MKDWYVFSPGHATLTVAAKSIMVPQKDQPLVAFLDEDGSLIAYAHLAPGGAVYPKPAK